MDIEGDAFGKIYEYFLGNFAMAEGQRGGEFFTSISLVKLIVEILEPYHGASTTQPVQSTSSVSCIGTICKPAEAKQSLFNNHLFVWQIYHPINLGIYTDAFH